MIENVVYLNDIRTVQSLTVAWCCKSTDRSRIVWLVCVEGHHQVSCNTIDYIIFDLPLVSLELSWLITFEWSGLASDGSQGYTQIISLNYLRLFQKGKYAFKTWFNHKFLIDFTEAGTTWNGLVEVWGSLPCWGIISAQEESGAPSGKAFNSTKQQTKRTKMEEKTCILMMEKFTNWYRWSCDVEQ